MTTMKIKRYRKGLTLENVVFRSINSLLLAGLVLATFYPYWNTIVTAFNDASDTITGGLYLWPRVWTIHNFVTVFATGNLVNAFFISVSRTVIAVILNIFITTMLAYALSQKEFVLRKIFTTIIVLTMYVSAGLIPYFFLIRSMGLINNFLVYVIPGMVSAFNFIIIRTYIHSIPESLQESARMDGATEFTIFLRIIFPLCKPVLATVALFVAVGSWNQWFDTFLFASGRQDLATLQYELMRILSSTMSQSKSAADIGAMGMAQDVASNMTTPVSIRAAITVVASLPILVVYPFLQRHFVVGLNVGGVKG